MVLMWYLAIMAIIYGNAGFNKLLVYLEPWFVVHHFYFNIWLQTKNKAWYRINYTWYCGSKWVIHRNNHCEKWKVNESEMRLSTNPNPFFKKNKPKKNNNKFLPKSVYNIGYQLKSNIVHAYLVQLL